MLSFLVAAALLSPSPELAPPAVYRSRGYGWLIDLRPGTTVLYQETGRACWPDPESSPSDLFATGRPRTDGGFDLRADEEPQTTVYVFDPVPDLPAACLSPSTDDRAAVEAVADLMSARYPGFGARNLDFEARRRAVLAALPPEPAPDAAFTAASDLLAGLDDAHIDLSAEIDGETWSLTVSQGRTLDAVNARPGERPERAWLGAWRRGVEQSVLRGQGHVAANNRIFWGLRDGVGYIAILTMGGFDPGDDEAMQPLEAALDEALAAFSSAKAVVVDVSNNRGGYDAVGLRIAARFADRPRVAYLKRGWGSGVAAQDVSIAPSSERRYLGPVHLLTSDITVSAGETFTQMMRVLPNVTHTGTPTRGALSDQTPVILANGWRFGMPMEVYWSPDGVLMEGRGLAPERGLELYPSSDLDHGHARAVSRLIDEVAEVAR